MIGHEAAQAWPLCLRHHLPMAPPFTNHGSPTESPLLTAQVALTMPAVSLVTAIDLGVEGNPHPLNKWDVAERVKVRGTTVKLKSKT